MRSATKRVPATSSGHGHDEPEPEPVDSSGVEFSPNSWPSPTSGKSTREQPTHGAPRNGTNKHPEALMQMGSIWQAWEPLRLEPALGISTWWLNHADPHMLALTDTKHTNT
ncbi:DUF4913 domain-containing protein [Arthrobacter sp. NPDC058130]|uniref:DUF4913 domain-containing protein n=1 Tax=Arthrobacter sp. NPDC058130 TaxID=3346353 RepID=UPI0036EF8130